MKKFLCCLCLILLLPLCFVQATEPQLQLSGPEAVYAKDSLQLYFSAQSGLTQIAFTLTYDTENLQFYGLLQPPGGTWQCSTAGQRLALSGKSGGSVPALHFQVGDAAPGTNIWVVLSDITVTVHGQERKLDDIRWEHRVDTPGGGENHLCALKISDGALQPAFSPYVQHYTATVSYHIASVDVTAVAQDTYASVSVHNPELKSGATTDITVTVTAQDGQSRVYTISVTREDDPNRPLSSQCDLSNLVVNGFLLSPAFDSRATEYVLWLPYEITSVEITATPKDSRATVAVDGNKGLKPGKDNPITVTCTAEDGTKKIYTVIAKRAAAHTEPNTNPVFPSNDASAQTLPALRQGTAPAVPSWTYVVLAVAVITGCAAFGILLSDRKK